LNSHQFFLGAAGGIIATIFMDLGAMFLVRRRWVNLGGLQIVPPLMGRWMMTAGRTGQVFHSDIRQIPSSPNEFRVGMIAHYVIGLILGLLYAGLMPLDSSPEFLFFLWSGLVYGFLTNALPWMVMYPSLGFGFFASRLPTQKALLKFSCVNHLVFGAALGVAVYLFLKI
jgi:hypothetical protein